MNVQEEQLDVDKIVDIIKRGNTAEVKKTKNGITIWEVSRRMRCKEPTNGKKSDDAEN